MLKLELLLLLLSARARSLFARGHCGRNHARERRGQRPNAPARKLCW